MTFREILHLSHREVVAYKGRSIATVIVVGLLFGLLIGGLMVWQGLEDVVLKYARETVDDRAEYSCEDEAIDNPSSDNVVYGVCRYFQKVEKDWVGPVSVILMIVGVLILAFTMAHVISQDTRTFMLYLALGASRGQIFIVYLIYLLEICVYAALFAVGLGVILAGVITAVGWDFLAMSLAETFPDSYQYAPVLLGWSWRCTEVIGIMFVMAPVAFVLCLDQFSEKKIALKLKGD